MAFYFAEGGDSTKVLGLTCHHVLFKTDADHYPGRLTSAGAPRRDVQLLGLRAFDKLLNSIRLRIGRHGIMVDIDKGQITKLERRRRVTTKRMLRRRRRS
jgi:hypothetical protein